MSWQDTLSKILESAQPISTSIARGELTLENAWTHPVLQEARERLVAELTKDGAIEEMMEAGRRLREQHQALLAKPTLTAEELRKLGVLSATAYALSGEALATAVTSKAIFMYTIRQLVPWLQRAADLAIFIRRLATGDRNIDAIDERPIVAQAPSHADRERELRLLQELVEVTGVLTRLLARRLEVV